MLVRSYRATTLNVVIHSMMVKYVTYQILSGICVLFMILASVLISTWCHMYVSVNWVIIGPGNGLSPVRSQAITWTHAGLFSIGLLGTYISEMWIGILSFSFKKMQLKMSLPKWRTFCPGGDELKRSHSNNLEQIHGHLHRNVLKTCCENLHRSSFIHAYLL